MAIWADIDDDDEPTKPGQTQLTGQRWGSKEVDLCNGDSKDFVNVGPSSYIAHALRCYPIAEKLASHLDLTDLDALSSTCHAVRGALVQFAYQLKQRSLRCAFEIDQQDRRGQEEQDAEMALHLSIENSLDLGGGNGPAFPTLSWPQSQPAFMPQSALGLTGKISRCARDLVAPCRNCGINICRNCIGKPPSNKYLPDRLRRLCDSCLEAPLILHKAPLHEFKEETAPASSASSTRSERSQSDVSDHSDAEQHLTTEVVSQMPENRLRDACTCASKGVYLCHQCAHNNIAADNIYQRVWRWRSKYSTHMGGGLGTGLGLGNQGQKCGRGQRCLATRDAMALMECECSSEDVSTPNGYELGRSNTPIMHGDGHEMRPEPGYFRQEIEGIGGQVKSKSRKLVKVGATVYEFKDERESGKYLGREASGDLRGWCSWCSRVCPSKQD